MATRPERLLTDAAQSVANEMAKRCGSLKLALSAGIMALKILSAEQRENAIAAANGLVEEPAPPKTIRETLRELVKKTKETGQSEVSQSKSSLHYKHLMKRFARRKRGKVKQIIY